MDLDGLARASRWAAAGCERRNEWQHQPHASVGTQQKSGEKLWPKMWPLAREARMRVTRVELGCKSRQSRGNLLLRAATSSVEPTPRATRACAHRRTNQPGRREQEAQEQGEENTNIVINSNYAPELRGPRAFVSGREILAQRSRRRAPSESRRGGPSPARRQTPGDNQR